MRNPKAVAMVAISIVLGLLAVLLASRWITQQAGQSSGKVVVASVDIELGSRLTPEMLRTVDWPAGSMPDGLYPDPAKLDTRVVKTAVSRGEPILESKLAPIGTKGGLSAVVAEGKRAMTVRVNDVVGVAGFALPGNYVDIVVNTQDESGKATGQGTTENRDPSISKIVLDHILVLAVAQEASRDDTKPKVVNAVTLEVSPDEAEKLDLARSVGTLSLVLRNQVDPKLADTRGATKLTLLGVKADSALPAPVKAAAATPHKPVHRSQPQHSSSRECVEIIQGSSRSLSCF